ncbi:MAG: hypothetical protein WAV70_06340 [Anaerolineae bacterium]
MSSLLALHIPTRWRLSHLAVRPVAGDSGTLTAAGAGQTCIRLRFMMA